MAAEWDVGGNTIRLWRPALGEMTNGDSLRITAQSKSLIGETAIRTMDA